MTSNYIPYTIYSNLGTCVASANGVLATQSLLYALGLGAGNIPLAAALNWILKVLSFLFFLYVCGIFVCMHFFFKFAQFRIFYGVSLL